MPLVDITEADAEAKRWAVHFHKHVVPFGDLIEHELSDTCPCHPREEEQGGGLMFVHHAFDQREDQE